MDFEDTPEERDFRQECRTFLDTHATRLEDVQVRYTRAYPTDEMIARARKWQAVKAEHGFAAITWPEKWGGRGGKPIHQLIYRQEERRYDVPRGVYEVAMGMCLPTLMAYADEATLERYLPTGISGQEIWCQLFSEPGGGTDLAGLRTKATRQGDGWLIKGQKIWTSRANIADFGLILTRTDPKVPKHNGLTAFYLDMRSPGITIRTIQQISGDHSFCEVFFDDVYVPDTQRLGEVGEGWRVGMTTLMHERLALSDIVGPHVEDLLDTYEELAETLGADQIPSSVRNKIADLYVRAQGVKFTEYRVMTSLSRGATPGPEATICKIVNAIKLQEIATLGSEMAGMSGMISDPDFASKSGWFQEAFMYAPGKRVAGGTDEILRNIIAERVLGLPPEPRLDKGIPFDEVRTSASR